MKKIIVIVLAIFFLFFLLSFFQKPLKVAACPTFYYMLEKLEKQGIETIPTNSTAESLQLLEKEKIDLAISGRNLRAGEPDFLGNKFG